MANRITTKNRPAGFENIVTADPEMLALFQYITSINSKWRKINGYICLIFQHNAIQKANRIIGDNKDALPSLQSELKWR